MDETESRTPGPDDTAAFKAFYDNEPATTAKQPEPSRWYRLFVSWWRDRR